MSRGKVQILMSTYNGEMFLEKQLDSILAQNYPIELLIRDDGSSDRTVEIIKRYQKKNKNICLVEGHNLGVISSFFELFRIADESADYFALADQDDIWFPNKVERAVSRISSMNSERPSLYCASQTLVDKQDELLKVSMKTVHMRPGFGNAIVENIATGCTCMFNRCMLKLVSEYEPEYTVMHDWWLYMLATAMGEIYYDQEPCMYYRQHGNNTMGSRTNYFEEFKERIKRFSGNKNKLYRQMQSFSRHYNLEDDNQEVIEMMLCYKKSIRAKIRCILSNKVYRQRISDNFIFKCLFLLNHI